MTLDKDKIQTQEETKELAPMDRANERVDAEMKIIEGQAKEQVAHGLQDKKLEKEAVKLKEEGEKEQREVDEETR